MVSRSRYSFSSSTLNILSFLSWYLNSLLISHTKRVVILSASFLCYFLFIYHPSFPMRKLGLDPFKVFLFVVLLILKVWDYEQWSTSCCLPTIKNQTIGFENRYDQISSCWLSLMCLCFSSLTHLFIYYFFCSDRIIFAVKEASLLDQGSQGKQSIYQLEQVKRMSYFEEMLIKYGLIFLIFVIKFFELFFFFTSQLPSSPLHTWVLQ